MALDPRRFDQIEKVVRDNARQLNDAQSTLLARLAAHKHAESDVTSLVADLANNSIPVVSSTASITSPYTGQIIYNTTDDMLYKYIGGVWVAFAATGTTNHEARYEQTSGQSIANTTDAKIQFPTATSTTSDVTASGTGNTDFLLNRGGVWLFTASIRYLAATTGERHLSICTGTTVGTLSARIAVQSTFPGNGPGSVAIATTKRLASGTSIFAATWQNNGTAVSLETAFGSTNHISLTWLRP